MFSFCCTVWVLIPQFLLMWFVPWCRKAAFYTEWDCLMSVEVGPMQSSMLPPRQSEGLVQASMITFLGPFRSTKEYKNLNIKCPKLYHHHHLSLKDHYAVGELACFDYFESYPGCSTATRRVVQPRQSSAEKLDYNQQLWWGKINRNS